MVSALLEKQLAAMGLILPAQLNVAEEPEVEKTQIIVSSGDVSPIAWDF